jgi:dual specificity phosphatase 12
VPRPKINSVSGSDAVYYKPTADKCQSQKQLYEADVLFVETHSAGVMGWVDLVPRAGNLYIGGCVHVYLFALYTTSIKCTVVRTATKLMCFSIRLEALYQRSLICSAHITHVLSVVGPSLNIEADLVKPFTHLLISVEDDPNENLLQYFGKCNAFIENGLESGGGVFVHW